jgi:TM2 domain-containing membrane protein YozV
MTARRLLVLCAVLGCVSVGPRAGAEPTGEEGRLSGFADELLRRGDHYRAITEYERFLYLYPEHPDVPTVRTRIAAAYYRGAQWDEASQRFLSIQEQYADQEAGRLAGLYLAAIALKQHDYGRALDALEAFERAYPDDPRRGDTATQRVLANLRWQRPNDGRAVFQEEAWTNGPAALRISLENVEEWKALPRKSPVLAGALSAALPGAGQVYVGRWGDAALAFVLNGLFFWGTYEAFANDEDVAGSLLLAMDATWYLGSIYNAVNGAQKANRLREEQRTEQWAIRYGWTFPPNASAIPMPYVGVKWSF